MKRSVFFLAFLLFVSYSFSQSVGINEDGSSPNSAAILDIKSTSKGILIPRMTSVQKGSLTLVEGLLIYQTDGTEGFYYYDGSSWQYIGNQTANGDDLGDHTATEDIDMAGYEIKLNGGYISNDGDDEGLKVDNNGIVTIGAHSPSANTRLSIVQTNTNATNYSLTALTSGAGTANTALYGKSTSGTNGNTGVFGEATGGNYSYGVHGYVTGTASETFGLYGHSFATGTTLYNAGVGGQATDTATNNIGIYSYAANASNNYSFYGEGGILYNFGNADIDGNADIGGDATVGGDIDVTGGVTLAISTKTTAYSITSSDYTIIGNPSGGNITFTLPDPSANSGKVFIIKNISTTDDVIIARNGSENIEGGAASYTLSSGTSGNFNFVTLQSDGTDWFIIAKN